MSGWFTDENGQLHKFAGGETSLKSALPVGAIFASALPLTDSSVHALDGTTISQTGLYEQFTIYLKSLIDAGYNINCTQEEFDNTVSTYGQCGKFVVNDNTKTIRLPLITEFVASNNGGQEIGLAQLDEFKSHTHIAGYSDNNWKVTSSGSQQVVINYDPYTTTNQSLPTTSSGGSETRPKNVRYPYYIVLLSGFDSNAVGGGSGGESTGTGQIILRRWS